MNGRAEPPAAASGTQGAWLAIDSATDRAGLALLGPEALLEEWQGSGRRRLAADLAPRMEAMLARQGLGAADLAGLAVAIGPGSYTGLRIGLALAKGLALGAGLPLVGVPTLDPLAAALSSPGQPRQRPLWALLQAGRGRLVAACYPPGLAWDRPVAAEAWPDARALAVWSVEDLIRAAAPPAMVAGELDASTRLRLERAGLEVLPEAAGVRRAAWLAELGRLRWAQAGPDDPERLAPIYPSR